mmetsp:Transcript_891/g.2924  ORF Transcript_891/g.2924 Transcript_891/m.2924 type:complete len:249 (-) Transcript_891:786-1532(-)
MYFTTAALAPRAQRHSSVGIPPRHGGKGSASRISSTSSIAQRARVESPTPCFARESSNISPNTSASVAVSGIPHCDSARRTSDGVTYPVRLSSMACSSSAIVGAGVSRGTSLHLDPTASPAASAAIPTGITNSTRNSSSLSTSPTAGSRCETYTATSSWSASMSASASRLRATSLPSRVPAARYRVSFSLVCLRTSAATLSIAFARVRSVRFFVAFSTFAAPSASSFIVANRMNTAKSSTCIAPSRWR